MTTGTNTKSTALSVDDIRAGTAEIAALHRKLTFVVPLTEAERREHLAARMGLKTLRKLENRVVAARQHRDLLPPAFDMRKFERDAALTGALGESLAAVEAMRQDIRDTLLAVGNRAVVAASIAYAHIKVASISAERLRRTVEKMALRGGRAAANGTEPAEVPKPAEITVAADPAADAAPPADKADKAA